MKSLAKLAGVKASASPNIALIKYWGKLPSQSDQTRNLATNPSLSMTLSRAQTHVRARQSLSKAIIHINGAPASEKDFAKVSAHIDRVATAFDIQDAPPLFIDSTNNFPQGTGIASSASAFAALTCAVTGLLIGADKTRALLQSNPQRLSELARRGSGSASRSIFAPYSYWSGGPNAEAFNCQWPLHDTILIFSRDHKKVPSSEGHEQATQSPFFLERLKNLPRRLELTKAALMNRDFSALKDLIELEALELHKIVASGDRPIDYFTPESRRFVDYLQKTKPAELAFTLDAGPNVHLLSEAPQNELIEALLADCFKESRPKIDLWSDKIGNAPSVLEDLTDLE
jgi:diphosphomevalonate decarboxylase